MSEIYILSDYGKMKKNKNHDTISNLGELKKIRLKKS